MEGCLLSLFFSGEKKSGKKQREKKSLTKTNKKHNTKKGRLKPFLFSLAKPFAGNAADAFYSSRLSTA